VRLVFITQRVDEDDPALGATVPKLRALAERVDELVVLALHAVPTELPANVRVDNFAAANLHVNLYPKRVILNEAKRSRRSPRNYLGFCHGVPRLRSG